MNIRKKAGSRNAKLTRQKLGATFTIVYGFTQTFFDQVIVFAPNAERAIGFASLFNISQPRCRSGMAFPCKWKA